MKFKQTLQTTKIASKQKYQQEFEDKGLILGKLELTKPMTVSFINQKLCKMLKYNQSECMGMIVNNFMPSIIAENHHNIIQNFYKTGKYNVINGKTNFLMK